MAPSVATLLLALLSVGASHQRPLPRLRRADPPTRRLLALRGGEPAGLAASQAADQVLPATPPPSANAARRKSSSRQKSKLHKKRPARRPFGIRDAAMGALCVSAISAALATNFDSILPALPQQARGVAWLLIGGSFSLGLYMLIYLVTHDRAMALCRLLFGVDPSTAKDAFARSIPAMLFGLGSVASLQSLPTAGG